MSELDLDTWEYIGKGTTGYRTKFKKEEHPRVDESTAKIVRDLFATGSYSYLQIAEEMYLTLPVVVSIMDGAIHPYAGGVLKRHPLGLCTKEVTLARDKKFCLGCLDIAFKAFKPEQFDIICEFNAMSPMDVLSKLQEGNSNDSQDSSSDL